VGDDINNNTIIILDQGFVIKLILNYLFLIALIKDSRLSILLIILYYYNISLSIIAIMFYN
jgi:hypothetical protein